MALATLMAELDSVVVKTTPNSKGDWRPIVYLFTDGRPSDNPNAAIERWIAKYATKAKYCLSHVQTVGGDPFGVT